MGSGGRHQGLLRRNQSCMDARQHPHGQGDLTEMAQGGVCGSGRALPDQRWRPARGHYLTSGGQYDIGWPRSDACGEIPQSEANGLKNEYGADNNSYAETVAKEFEKLLEFAEKGNELNLWFEYELFCQVNMWFCLHLLQDTKANVFRVLPMVRNKEEIWKGFVKNRVLAMLTDKVIIK